MKEKLRLLVALMAIMVAMSNVSLADPPVDWVAPTGMQFSMTMIAQLQLAHGAAGELLEHENNRIAAFVNGEIRGVSIIYPQVGFEHLHQITIYSPINTGVIEIDFKAYYEDDEGLGTLAEIVDVYENNEDAAETVTIEFVNGATLGTVAAPYIFVPFDGNCNFNVSVVGAMNDDGDEIISTVSFGEEVLPFFNEDGDGVLNIDHSVECLSNSLEFVISPGVGQHLESITIGTDDPIIDENLEEALEALEDGTFLYTYEWEWEAGTDIDDILFTFAKNNYTIKYIAGANGKVSETDPDAVGYDPDVHLKDWIEKTVEHGDDQDTPIYAVPDDDEEYEFFGWSDGVIGNERTDENVTEGIEVTALFGPKGWTVGDLFPYNMQLTGLLYINGEQSTNPNNLVGAFVKDEDGEWEAEPRGIASPNPDFDHMIFLTIGSETQASETIYLRIWNSEPGEGEDDICIAAPAITFELGGQIGDLDSPHIIQCEIEQEYAFSTGFTWFSTNINKEDNWELDDYFSGLVDGDGDPLDPHPFVNDDRIMGQSSFAVYHNDHWLGALTEISPKHGYRFKRAEGEEEFEFVLIGAAVEYEVIDLYQGFTWVGYMPPVSLTVNNALAGFNAANDDRIIGQGQFAIYSSALESWVGDLTHMYPGNAYVIKSASASTLDYSQAIIPPAMKQAPVEQNKPASPAGYQVRENMKNTMMLVGKVAIEEAEYAVNQNDMLYAFIDGECRGMAAPAEDGYIFMSIGENTEEAKEISFMLWIDELNQLVELEQKLGFGSFAMAGTLDEPFIFKLGANETAGPAMIGKAYPNPFTLQTTIPVVLHDAAQLSLKVFNNMGQLVQSTNEVVQQKGTHKLQISNEGLKPGVYYYTVEIHTHGKSIQESGMVVLK